MLMVKASSPLSALQLVPSPAFRTSPTRAKGDVECEAATMEIWKGKIGNLQDSHVENGETMLKIRTNAISDGEMKYETNRLCSWQSFVEISGSMMNDGETETPCY